MQTGTSGHVARPWNGQL